MDPYVSPTPPRITFIPSLRVALSPPRFPLAWSTFDANGSYWKLPRPLVGLSAPWSYLAMMTPCLRTLIAPY